MGRSHICPKTGLKRGAWAQDEDHLLASYVKRYGHCNWRELPKKAGLLRCGKSCRLRWMNYLRPNIKRGNYTKEEDELIIKLHEKLGNKWSIIAANLPGRTDNEIKNHWHCDLKHSPTTKEAMKNKKLKQCETAVGSEASFEFDSNIWSEPFDMDEWCVPEEPSAQCETIGEVNTSTPQFMESSGFLRSSPGVENLSSFDDADSWSGHFQMDDLCTPGGAPSIMGFPPSPQCETAVGSEARFEFDSNIWSEPFDMDGQWCVPEEPSGSSAQCETVGEVNTSTPQFMESSGFLRFSPGVENLSSFDDADSWSGHFQMDDLCIPGGAPSIMGFPPSPLSEALHPYDLYDMGSFFNP